ncbi:MAG: YihY/virulence factor BrkB family protein [Pseudolabrys sp.]
MAALEPSARREDARRAALASLALGGVLYWLGFARRDRRVTAAPARAMSAARRPLEPHLAPVAARPQSWRDVASHVWENIGRHRILAIAAGVTFYALLAIFPAIAAIVTVYGLFADTGSIAGLLDSLAGVVPGGALIVIGDEVTRIASGPPASLSVTLVVSLLISLWSANAGMKAIFDALNVVYNAEEKRSFIRLNLVSLGFTLSAVVFLLAAMASVVVVPIVLNYLSIRSSAAPLVALARWPAMFTVTVFALSLVYRFGPDREEAQWRWITWGSATAAVVWLAASLLFSWYAANFGNYNATYGSLGAVIGFMTWMWLSTIVILTGAEIDAVMERWDRGSAH